MFFFLFTHTHIVFHLNLNHHPIDSFSHLYFYPNEKKMNAPCLLVCVCSKNNVVVVVGGGGSRWSIYSYNIFIYYENKCN